MMVIMAPLHADAKERAHIKRRAKKAGKPMNTIIRELIQADMDKVKK